MTAVGLQQLVERSGIDWLLVLIGKQPFRESPLSDAATLEELEERFSDTHGEALIEAVARGSELLGQVDQRTMKVEQKAYTLMGGAGIATSFLVGFAAMLTGGEWGQGGITLRAAVLLYVLIVGAFVFSILLGMKAVAVRDYHYARPKAIDVTSLATGSVETFRQKRAAALYYSFVRNSRETDRKATYLGGAQLYFGYGAILSFVAAVALAWGIVGGASGGASGVGSSIQATATVAAEAATPWPAGPASTAPLGRTP